MLLLRSLRPLAVGALAGLAAAAGNVRAETSLSVTWQRGSASFYENINPPLSEFPLNLDAWKLLDAGLSARIRSGLETALMLQRAQDRLEVDQTAITRINLSGMPNDAVNCG